jgi:hypothetical protein
MLRIVEASHDRKHNLIRSSFQEAAISSINFETIGLNLIGAIGFTIVSLGS